MKLEFPRLVMLEMTFGSSTATETFSTPDPRIDALPPIVSA